MPPAVAESREEGCGGDVNRLGMYFLDSLGFCGMCFLELSGTIYETGILHYRLGFSII